MPWAGTKSAVPAGGEVAGSAPVPPLVSTEAIDLARAHPARLWNYWLGGKDHYPIDRELGDGIREVLPEIVAIARSGRYFLARMVRALADEYGVDQFLDVGAGLPSVDNTHDLVRSTRPDGRVVYVDNDPLVLAHGNAMFTSVQPATTVCIEVDIREPDAVMARSARILDFRRPVAVLLLGVLHFLTEEEEPLEVIRRITAALSPGSFLAVAHMGDVGDSLRIQHAVRLWNLQGRPPLTPRSPQQIADLIAGLEVLDPGVVSVPRWRPDPGPWDVPELPYYCAVARTPQRGTAPVAGFPVSGRRSPR